MMLEGKMPVTMMAATATSNSSSPSHPSSGGEIVYQDRIVYRDGNVDNK